MSEENDSQKRSDFQVSKILDHEKSSEKLDIKPCNCEKSKCLKLYCECFAHSKICTKFCNCRDCHNNHLNSVK